MSTQRAAIGSLAVLLLLSQAALGQEAIGGDQPGLPYKEEPYRPPAAPFVLKLDEARLPSAAELQVVRAAAVSAPASLGSPGYKQAVESTGWELGSQVPAVQAGAQAGTSAPFIEVVEIQRPSAAWIRLTFKDVDLQRATLHVSTPDSKQAQTFNAQSLRDWENTTAIFDGDRVRVLLQTRRGAGFPSIRLQTMIEAVAFGTSSKRTPYPGELLPRVREQAAGPMEQSACEEDKRTFSKNPLVGRMRPAACTVFLIEGGIAATAGHCLLNGEYQMVSFNVPHSDEYGMPAESDLQKDVYKIVPSTIQCRNCKRGAHDPAGHGNDWALFRLSPNLEGTAAHANQGGGYKIDTNSRAPDVLVYGFGWDTRPPQASYASQASVGPFVSISNQSSPQGVTISHLADTAGGSSGSPIVWKRKPESVMGIHVAGSDCTPQRSSPNKGTSFTNPELANAVASLISAAGTPSLPKSGCR